MFNYDITLNELSLLGTINFYFCVKTTFWQRLLRNGAALIVLIVLDQRNLGFHVLELGFHVLEQLHDVLGVVAHFHLRVGDGQQVPGLTDLSLEISVILVEGVGFTRRVYLVEFLRYGQKFVVDINIYFDFLTVVVVVVAPKIV